MIRTVTSHLACTVTEPATICLEVAVAGNQQTSQESLEVTVDGNLIEVEELRDQHGTRLSVISPPKGHLEVAYSATVVGSTPLVASPTELWEYVRPSRYAESDVLASASGDLFGSLSGRELATAVAEWVYQHTAYVSGISKVTDSAEHTYVARKGICRDFAHLTCAFLRARNVPARLAAVYAPGLEPMDFHAVTEVYLDGKWYVLDATRLAPRESLVRIATGRDAADTAFMTVTSGRVNLDDISVTATVDGDLPQEDPAALVELI